MTAFPVMLLLAAFLCSVVTGLLFAFAVVVMPGINKLDNGSFIRTFQAIDRVIQHNQPLFVLVWMSSILAVAAAAVMSIWALSGTDRLLAILAALIYVLGVQLPTVAVNVPLNNVLQNLDPGAMNDAARKLARSDFEPRWNRWNAIRTVCSTCTSILLLRLLLRL